MWYLSVEQIGMIENRPGRRGNQFHSGNIEGGSVTGEDRRRKRDRRRCVKGRFIVKQNLGSQLKKREHNVRRSRKIDRER